MMCVKTPDKSFEFINRYFKHGLDELNILKG